MEGEYQQLMRARQNIYDLLRCFYLQEPAANFLEALREIDFFPALSGYHPILDKGLDLLRQTIFAAPPTHLASSLIPEYTRLFIGPQPIPLYESVYRSSSGLLNQEETLAVRKFYKEAGLLVHPACSIPEDHIGTELEFVFFLCQRAAQAQEKKEQEFWAEIQYRFFRDHLRQWINLFCDRLFQETTAPYYQAVSLMTKGFVDWDYQEIVSHFGPER
ncbi:MAG: TorD/DmsD family molecular chaperone [Thermodesulfobacteriota bacterium]